MAEEPPPAPSADAEPTEGKEKSEKKKKKDDKVRSAWISFVGRIVAQIVGAAATIVLGLAVAGRLSGPDGRSRERREPAKRLEPRTPPAPSGPRLASLAVLPLQNLSGDPQQEYFADGMTEALISSLAKIRGL